MKFEDIEANLEETDSEYWNVTKEAETRLLRTDKYSQKHKKQRNKNKVKSEE